MTNALILEVIDGYHMPIQGLKKDGTTYTQQKMFMHNGGPFPIEVLVSIESPVHARPIGKYTLSPSAFRADRYSNIELNKWELSKNIVPYDDSEKVRKIS